MAERVTLLSRRAFLRGLAGAFGAAALGACGSRALVRGGGRPTIRVAGGQFGFPSPFAYIAAPGYWKVSYIYDTLLWPDSTGQELPWLASRYDRSDDGMVYRVELRPAMWHNEKPLTSRDVAFTFDYFASQHLSPLIIASPRSVAKVVETGARTLEIRLEQPDVTFTKSVLGSVPIVPEHIWSTIAPDDAQAEQRNEVLIGTGPYRMTARDPAQGRLLFQANDAFYLGTPYVQRIEEIEVDDELAAVRAGQLDGGTAPVEGIRNEVLDPFRRDPAFGVISVESGFAYPLYWNLSRGGALADLRFRRACLMAINREDLVKRLLTGNGQVGSAGFLPPGHRYHVEVEGYPYDPDGASRLLDEAGYRQPSPGGVRQSPDGTPLRFTLFNHDTVPPALPDLVVANLKAVGVEVAHHVVDLVRLFGIKTAPGGGNYDMLINLYPGPVGTTPNADPDILRPVYHSHPPNQLYSASGYANPELDQLLDRQLVTQNEDQRKEIVGEIQRIVARDLPVAVLYYTTMFFVFRKRTFDNWYFTQGGFGPGVPDVYNKHAMVTGRKTGLDIRKPGSQ